MMGFSCSRCYSHTDIQLRPLLSTIPVSDTLAPLLRALWSHSPFHSPGHYYFLLFRLLLSVPGHLPVKSLSTHFGTHFQTTSFLLPGLLAYLLIDTHNSPLITCSGSPIHSPIPNSFSFSQVFICQVSPSHTHGSNTDFFHQS